MTYYSRSEVGSRLDSQYFRARVKRRPHDQYSGRMCGTWNPYDKNNIKGVDTISYFCNFEPWN